MSIPTSAVPAPGHWCDSTSVGAVIRDAEGRVLTFRRATPPPGIAGPAGHVDDHGTPEQAIVDEVREEVGLTVVSYEQIASEQRSGACRRMGGELGHWWWLFEVRAEGELAPSWRETRDAAWRSPSELQQLAERTIAFARGRVGVGEFATDPGVEPVWVRWFDLAGVVAVTADDLAVVEQLLRDGGPAA
jgi:8-oxo-dGTP pyrophosphatase MutT (NUDIX family)